jgi:hypothetical protein
MHGVKEPVNTCMMNIVTAAHARYKQQQALAAVQQTESVVISCMCCFHWVARRQAASFVRFPIQNLYWYTKCLSFNKRRNYDARIMHRVACGIVSAHKGRLNYYATLFSEEDMAFLRKVAAAPVAALHQVAAQHYMEQNASPLFLPDAHVTDVVRAAAHTSA